MENSGKICINRASNGVSYITFRQFEELSFIKHAFSTREGGVSEGIYESMNLAWNRGDNPSNVAENYRRFGEAIGVSPEKMIYAHQTHTIKVLRVDVTFAGMGVVRERSFQDVDALITDEPELCLVTGHADCIPLYFVDPVKKAIGLAHSGWKGTANNIADNVVRKMGEEFGSVPTDLRVLIGPGICGGCYEVGYDVARIFIEKYGDRRAAGFQRGVVILYNAGKKGNLGEAKVVCEEKSVKKAETGAEEAVKSTDLEDKTGPMKGPDFFGAFEEEKFLLDLPQANFINLINSGVPETQVYLSSVCTMENPKLIFSHRATKGQRGGSAAFLQIK